MPDAQGDAQALRRRKRLLPEEAYEPWVRAEQQITDIFLFWMPVSSFPMRHQEKIWLSEFLQRLSGRLLSEFNLRAELFFQYKGVPDVADDFRRYAQKCQMRIGVGRFGDEELAGIPPPEVVAEYIEKRKMFDSREWIADYLYWFVSKQPEEQRKNFLGFGHMLTLFLPPDPGIQPLKLTLTPALRDCFSVLKKYDVESMIAGSFSMRDAFQAKSKLLFGAGLEVKPEYPGIAFVLPLLQSAHFFIASEELRSQWFDLFDVYVNESTKDKGVLLAFRKEEYEDTLVEVLESMRLEGFKYVD